MMTLKPAVTTGFCSVTCDNGSGPGGATNTRRGLTHSSDLTREGLGMKPTHCAVCGAILTHPASGRSRIVCSRACRTERRRRAWNAEREAGAQACVTCGQPISPEIRRDALYCSAQCSSRARANREGRQPVAPADQRFWSRVLKHPDGGCWEWTGAKLASGYGSFRVNNRAHVVHRYAWELLRGPIPDGLQVDHLCRNRSCLNPDHLEPVTQEENLRRARVANGNRDHLEGVA